MKNLLSNYRLILASKSPRRKELLERSNIPFTIRTLEVEEIYPESLPKSEVAEYLAILKAEAARPNLGEQEIVLGADSIVILQDTIYGKPKDVEDAHYILRQLSGQTHEVITGVCLLSKNKKVSFSAVSKVWMKELTEEEIAYYVDTYKPFDKAGAYAIQEWIGLCKISKIEGTYSNIMGLPTEMVYRALRAF
jgi:MAF protein